MNPQKIVELANLLRNKGDKILNSEFAFTLSGSLLRALNDSFTLITDSLDNGGAKNFQVLKTINAKSSVFRDLQLIYDFVQKTPLLCIVHYPSEENFEGPIDISKFRALKRLEVQKTPIQQVIGIQPLRAQLQQIICIKSIHSVDDIITKCGGDNSNGFVWNELKIANFSYNNLKQVDTSLEFAQYLQHLNLRHNQLQSVAAIKWLPYLKTLDLSFNRLLAVPQFHMDACKRLETLNMSNNLLEDLMGIVKLDTLSDLDISDNCLLDHSYLLPLSVLLCLKTLNLYGNPLHCHPKHRLATAQYLNKKCAAIKFVLDYEPLTKKEKNLLGSQKLKQVGALNRYSVRSSSTAISTPGRLTPASNHTPSSSLGSIKSSCHLNGSDNSSEINTAIETQKPKVLKRKPKNKNRTVEIEDSVCPTVADNVDSQFQKHLSTKSHQSNDSMSKSLLLENQQNQDHLETKRHVENLRKKYGNEWLQEDKVETLNSVLGLANNSLNDDIERNKSRQLFQEYIQLVPQNQIFDNNNESNTTVRTSTPTEEMHNNTIASEPDISPIPDNLANATPCQTPEQTQVNSSEISAYQSIESDHDHEENQNETANGNVLDLDSIYKQQYNSNDTDGNVSEPEEDEETYIAYRVNSKEPTFLTKSFHFLRERDTITKRTKCKWSLKILESCDRIKANTLRINFDTVKLDKQERIYTVAEDLCHKLEKDLRDILSQRDLTEMNQTVYRCVNCNCQFSQEQRFQYKQSDIHCPNCKSTFVAEMHELSKSLEKAPKLTKLSPAAIVEELPDTITPLKIQQELLDSIGKGNTTLSEINPELLVNTNMKANTISSANSLNDSSSCTKITGNNSEGSLNSQHSLVSVASINAENYLKSNVDSDIDIISNPSQSSIEVLGDSNGESRKTSEERHVSQVPNLETIDDSSCTPKIFEREFHHYHQDHNESKESKEIELKEGDNKSKPLAVLNITENSFAGYAAHDSGATNDQKTEMNTNSEFLTQETNANSTNTSSNESNGIASKKNETNSLSSMFGGLFQSTNVLMSSSKKLLEAESSINLIHCQPYKFNYSDFNDIDHRLKLFLYQTQFKERDEHFKWLVKGHLYNPQTAIACKGLIIISTCKCYVMEAFAVEHDDVGKWLKPIVTCTIDRLEQMQLLPWKLGLTIKLKDWGTFLLLLQDILRTDSLMLHFANNSLPSQCALIYQPCDMVIKRLAATVADQQLQMFSLLNACEITFEKAKRSLNLCGLITTDSHIYLTTPKIGWLCADNEQTEIEVCVAQLMTNLVEVERLTEEIILISFLDENVNKEEQWRCTFETSDNATSCLNAVAQSWEKLFGVPLMNA